MDGSVSMFWETNYGGISTPELVAAVQPGARFILMVRNPADRLYSDYIYFAYRTRHGASNETCVGVSLRGVFGGLSKYAQKQHSSYLLTYLLTFLLFTGSSIRTTSAGSTGRWSSL